MKYDRHPEILTSVSIIRTHAESDPHSKISSLAIFTVRRRSRLDVAFQLEHHIFDRHDDPAEILQGLVRSIPTGATVLVRQSRQDRRGMSPPLPTDAQILARDLPSHTVIAFEADAHELGEAGLLIGLDLPGRDSTPLRRRRRAPLHAQAAWVIFAASFCSPREQRVLYSAHLAWRAIQRANQGVGAG